MKRENIALFVSIFAFIVSVASFWSSRIAERRSETVAFEQRRQGIKQLISEARLIGEQTDREIRAALRDENDPGLREAWADLLGTLNRTQKRIDPISAQLDALPARLRTKHIVALEQVRDAALEGNRDSRDILEQVRSLRSKRSQYDANR